MKEKLHALVRNIAAGIVHAFAERSARAVPRAFAAQARAAVEASRESFIAAALAGSEDEVASLVAEVERRIAEAREAEGERVAEGLRPGFHDLGNGAGLLVAEPFVFPADHEAERAGGATSSVPGWADLVTEDERLAGCPCTCERVGDRRVITGASHDACAVHGRIVR